RLLDMDSLNRLLHLDSRTLTVKRAVPLDPTVWARVRLPPPLPTRTIVKVVKREYTVEMREATPVTGGSSGTIPLINPDGDTPHEESITPENSAVFVPGTQKVQMEDGRSWLWYVAGVQPKEGVITYPPSVLRGGIRHDGEQDPFSEAPIGGGFVALQRKEGGGMRVEGVSHAGDFFWAARHQAPSMACRSASPAQLLWSPAALEKGALVGMYQWYDLQSLWKLCSPGEKVALWGRAVMRVTLPDRGECAGARLVIALVERSKWEPRAYATVFDKTAVTLKKQSPWFPEKDPALIAGQRSLQKKGELGAALLTGRWVEQYTADLEVIVEGAAPILYLGLHGRSPGGEDVEAYFDKVGVDWARGGR
ncbi:MAG TPA: hypothetical protein PLA94_31550, partial [Myxococcota bacterium]|nr:hypothetical protein [Myxococcota bacterium]